MRTVPAPVLAVTAVQRTTEAAALRRRDLAPRLRDRLEMVEAAARGQELTAIARGSGRTPASVRHWLAAYQEGGIAALADAPRQGRPAKAAAADRVVLAAAVATPPRTLGGPCAVWTASRLSASLCQQTGVHIAPGWRRVVWHRQRFAWGRPNQARDHRQDPAAVAAGQAARRVAGETGAGTAGAL